MKEEFGEKWSARYPMIAKSWRSRLVDNHSDVRPADEIRRAVYMTNTIESLNLTLRKVIKNRASFPSDEAAFKLLYLALKNIAKKWTRSIKNWSAAMNQFAILFEERVPSHELNSFTQSI